MRTPMKGALAAIALTALLAGCATYDYGYAYDRSYYGYDRPYYGYDYGPYYYDYGPYPYGPAYYYGAPSVGFNLGFRDFDHRHFDRHDRYDRHDRSDRRGFDRGRGNVSAQQQPNTRPARVNRTGNQQQRSTTATRRRVPPAAPAQHAQRERNRPAAQSTMRAEQQ